MIHKNDICPLCGQTFADGDDVVYCPDCGTPHHRACWMEKGGCANADKHADGFVWQSEGADDAASPSESAAKCPRCGQTCADNALVCPTCGYAFGRNAQNEGRFDYNEAFFLRGVDLDPAQDLGGVTVGDTAVFVQTRAADYVRKFSEGDGKVFGWNWAAFFFSPFWFFYRKAYRAGALFLGVLMILGVFAAIPLGKVQDETLAVFEQYVQIDENSTYEQLVNDYSSLQGEAQQKVQAALLRYAKATMVYIAVLFVPNLFAAALADSLYKKKVVRDVQSMRDFAKDDRTFRMLALRRGGVSALGLVLCYLLISMFFRFVFYMA